MRTIKFRAKNKESEDNEWVYGYLLYDYNVFDEYVPYITWKDDTFLGGVGERAVLEETIGQFTRTT